MKNMPTRIFKDFSNSTILIILKFYYLLKVVSTVILISLSKAASDHVAHAVKSNISKKKRCYLNFIFEINLLKKKLVLLY